MVLFHPGVVQRGCRGVARGAPPRGLRAPPDATPQDAGRVLQQHQEGLQAVAKVYLSYASSVFFIFYLCVPGHIELLDRFEISAKSRSNYYLSCPQIQTEHILIESQVQPLPANHSLCPGLLGHAARPSPEHSPGVLYGFRGLC